MATSIATVLRSNLNSYLKVTKSLNQIVINTLYGPKVFILTVHNKECKMVYIFSILWKQSFLLYCF